MSVDSLVFWAFVAAWIVVVALLVFVQLPRIAAEVLRIVRHVVRLIEGSPLPLKIAKAEADLARIDVALAKLPGLRARFDVALTTLRTTSFVPLAYRELVIRVRYEISEFRRSLG